MNESALVIGLIPDLSAAAADLSAVGSFWLVACATSFLAILPFAALPLQADATETRGAQADLRQAA